MRIVQLSDIHLNNDNLQDLKYYFLEALLRDLNNFHASKPLDLIIFTGDLIDKGGLSLGESPYEVFQQELILPIVKSLGITNDQIVFIPGNHDVNRNLIDKYSESGLCSNLDIDSANKELNSMRSTFSAINQRIAGFKDFEKSFHKENKNYQYSNNESSVVFNVEGRKIGIALINDSWRCSSTLTQEQHFIGSNQLFTAKDYFSRNATELNIVAFHHPLNSINQDEGDEIDNILQSQDFDIALFGHSHKHEAKSLLSSIGGYLKINGRAAFNAPREQIAKFQPGYNILDVDIDKRTYTLYARQFIRDNGFRFDSDTLSLPGGQESGKLPGKGKQYYELVSSEDPNNDDNPLPNSYSADVHRIVNLLIGKSLYPDPYSFVRELIQNSVDACNRVRKKHTHLNPKILIKLNSQENYFEVCDDGDGMTKSILKNHFAVIGKSISQEFNDYTGNFNLISQFGIGFISTFIVAEKVLVDTKHEDDEHIVFEINDVFKRFNYLAPSSVATERGFGTTIRVYLKKGYNLSVALQHVKTFCRHIENLEVYIDSSELQINNTWNLENSNVTFEINNERYNAKLGISASPRPLIASNSGFLIANDPPPIIPFKFPMIIGGEVNFLPKGIDFDMSRTKIMETKNSETFRIEMSISLRKLFREALELGDAKVSAAILNYLHYYLVNFENDNANMQKSYSDFYSKKELVTLCSENTILNYLGKELSLKDIIVALKLKSHSIIFYVNSQQVNDYQLILIQFLESQGYLVVRNRSFNVVFRDGPVVVSILNVVQQIASMEGFFIQDISQAQGEVLKDMQMDKSSFPEKLQKHILKIEERYSVTVDIGKFSKLPKPSVRNGHHIFLNYDHGTFQSLLVNMDIADEIFEIYLLGLLGLQLQFPNS